MDKHSAASEKQPCILVATLGKSPGVVTTTIDALYERGYETQMVHCLALPRAGVTRVGNELFRTEEDPRVDAIERMLFNRATDDNAWTQRYPWNPELHWHVLNIERPDLVDSDDHFRFFQGCARVLADVETQVGENGELTGWLSLAGGRKSMSALAHTASFFFAPSLRLCHVTVTHDYQETHDHHWHPPSGERTFIELPTPAMIRQQLSPDIQTALLKATFEASSFDDWYDRQLYLS
ncbi:MAG: hypothetical protein HPY44_18875 [Armatimonadetes bacterium]|nr:hypothetical protein [Armatimonadota bacterium]